MDPILIPIKQDKPGFDRFIGSWLYQGRHPIVVDVGPSRSINILVRRLSELDVKRVDFVLLTHIHIDHAGGLAEFLKAFPMARVICHAKAIRHLVDPAKLRLGTQKSLGELAFTYGPISPVNKETLIPHTEAHIPDLEIVETPGHAPHHLSYFYEGNLFVGEAAGVYLTAGGLEYLRPATPPTFFLKEFVESLERLLIQENSPIFYGHFGKAGMSRPMLKRAKDQLFFWEKIISEELSTGHENPVEQCMKRLLREDFEMKAFEMMTPEDQARERFFLKNSVKGYAGYLQALSSDPLEHRP
ncbi:MAG: MBL fold metallo-hydrolase [Deltaproteobacteria bacterium]|nr:MBL fold metallo-hydrolase [Deltaproteobacteria bacterium]